MDEAVKFSLRYAVSVAWFDSLGQALAHALKNSQYVSVPNLYFTWYTVYDVQQGSLTF
jgi:hypothetical protein